MKDGLIDPLFEEPTYVSGVSFKVSGDVTDWLRPGRGLVINFETSGIKRGVVDTLVYDEEEDETVINIVGDELVEEEIISVLLSLSDWEGLYTN